ncbi:MAG: sodium:solute symporter, partial [Cyclobacteriaceae bacterium]|nr:sodium:solute symporter [Cyclobacteriaceae bacterium]
PVFFNKAELETVVDPQYKEQLNGFENDYAQWHEENKILITEYSLSENDLTEEQKVLLNESAQKGTEIRNDVKELLLENNRQANVKDSDYIFISFILRYLPHGIIGLLLAVIFSAAMSSTAGELNALGSTSLVDFHKRFFVTNGTDRHYLIMSKVITGFWGITAIGFALMAQLVENLIEFVNIIGSIFYGTILGIFLVAFFLKKVRGSAVFIAGVIAQSTIFIVHFLVVKGVFDLSYLMYNVIGCMLVILISLVGQLLQGPISPSGDIEIK